MPNIEKNGKYYLTDALNCKENEHKKNCFIYLPPLYEAIPFQGIPDSIINVFAAVCFGGDIYQ
jgi:hypothetical protein